jgi:uncharacterized SAM-binding protein YcdF (DUF218 family)
MVFSGTAAQISVGAAFQNRESLIMAPADISDHHLRCAQVIWDYHAVFDELKPADAIVGLGSYDLRVAARCAEIYHQGLAPKIIFSGASGNWTKGLFQRSEAHAFACLAYSSGVPEHAVTLEEQATNTSENIRFSAKFLPPEATVIFVSKSQMQRRCRATVAKHWPTATPIITAPLHGFDQQPTDIVRLAELICEIVGDLRRLQLYPELGYMAYEEIPANVLHAHEVLVSAGFTDHLPN